MDKDETYKNEDITQINYDEYQKKQISSQSKKYIKDMYVVNLEEQKSQKNELEMQIFNEKLNIKNEEANQESASNDASDINKKASKKKRRLTRNAQLGFVMIFAYLIECLVLLGISLKSFSNYTEEKYDRLMSNFIRYSDDLILDEEKLIENEVRSFCDEKSEADNIAKYPYDLLNLLVKWHKNIDAAFIVFSNGNTYAIKKGFKTEVYPNIDIYDKHEIIKDKKEVSVGKNWKKYYFNDRNEEIYNFNAVLIGSHNDPLNPPIGLLLIPSRLNGNAKMITQYTKLLTDSKIVILDKENNIIYDSGIDDIEKESLLRVVKEEKNEKIEKKDSIEDISLSYDQPKIYEKALKFLKDYTLFFQSSMFRKYHIKDIDELGIKIAIKQESSFFDETINNGYTLVWFSIINFMVILIVSYYFKYSKKRAIWLTIFVSVMFTIMISIYSIQTLLTSERIEMVDLISDAVMLDSGIQQKEDMNVVIKYKTIQGENVGSSDNFENETNLEKLGEIKSGIELMLKRNDYKNIKVDLDKISLIKDKTKKEALIKIDENNNEIKKVNGKPKYYQDEYVDAKITDDGKMLNIIKYIKYNLYKNEYLLTESVCIDRAFFNIEEVTNTKGKFKEFVEVKVNDKFYDIYDNKVVDITDKISRSRRDCYNVDYDEDETIIRINTKTNKYVLLRDEFFNNVFYKIDYKNIRTINLIIIMFINTLAIILNILVSLYTIKRIEKKIKKNKDTNFDYGDISIISYDGLEDETQEAEEADKSSIIDEKDNAKLGYAHKKYNKFDGNELKKAEQESLGDDNIAIESATLKKREMNKNKELISFTYEDKYKKPSFMNNAFAFREIDTYDARVMQDDLKLESHNLDNKYSRNNQYNQDKVYNSQSEDITIISAGKQEDIKEEKDKKKNSKKENSSHDNDNFTLMSKDEYYENKKD